ncbi:type IV secretory system conjugative DNA transfer family protein [Arthrobacter flavus]|uniref:Type IV secretory system conjugative DNA transfer family protein n=1 Tax=Arthrobacter flavus TaxID=95172 RepID=A0ABW4Q6V8_9MICC
MASGMQQAIYRLARAGGIETNPMTFTQKSGVFSSAATENGSATLLTRREDTGLNGYLILPEKSLGSNAPLHLAHTVGARAEEAELPDDLGNSPAIGELTYRRSPALRETQSGIDPTELPRLLANAMPAGSWVAVTMRKPANKERTRYTAWLANRLGTAVPTHHSVHPTAVAMTITAGGSTKDEVRALLHQVTAGMPGFDLDSDISFRRARHRASVLLPIGLLLAAATIFGIPYLPGEIKEMVSEFTAGLLTASVVAAVIGIIGLSGKIGSPDADLRKRLDRAEFPVPPARKGRPAPPRKEKTVRGTRQVGENKVPYEKTIPASDGDYPLHPHTFLVGPTVVVGMVSPHAGALSGEKVTRSRSVPPAMGQPIGPLLGYEAGSPAYLSAQDAFAGTAVLGVPNSGKSLLIRSLFGWHCLERARPSGRPGYPGNRNTLVAFESKGDGVEKYLAWAHSVGDRALVIDVADAATPAIDIFAVPGDNAAKASFFTNAMVYVFGSVSIGARSVTTLKGVLTAALAVDDELLESMDDRDPMTIPLGRSPMYYAYLLLGGMSDKVGVDLASGIRGRAVQLRERGTPSAELEQATAAISFLYDGKSESARRTFTEAPYSKIEQLLGLEEWWTPSRKKVTWEQILEGHRSVVINTGTSASGVVLDDNVNQAISSMLMYSMQHAIKRICSGWQSHGRSVSLFADELSLLAGNSPEIISWLRDQGRSFGCRPFLATQRPEQLPPALRNNLLTYGTLISFAQSDVSTSVEVAANMGSVAEWTQDDVQHLEPYHVLVRSHVGQRRQSAFIVKLPNHEADMSSYPEAQGYAA